MSLQVSVVVRANACKWRRLANNRRSVRRLAHAILVLVCAVLHFGLAEVFGQDLTQPVDNVLKQASGFRFDCGTGEQPAGKLESKGESPVITSVYTDPIVITKDTEELRLIVRAGRPGIKAIHLDLMGFYRRDGSPVRKVTLLDDGSQGDRIVGDGLFTVDHIEIDHARLSIGDDPIGKFNFATRGIVLDYGDGRRDSVDTALNLDVAFVDPSKFQSSPPRQIAPGVYASDYTVQFVADPGADGQQLQVTEIARRFYELFDDSFDFLAMNTVGTVPAPYAGRYRSVSNDVYGIGTSIYSGAEYYGSGGRLQGIIELPHRSINLLLLNHEVLHRWAFHLDSRLDLGAGHWGVVQREAAGGFGWWYGTAREIAFRGSGMYRAYLYPANRRENSFNDLELYLMGLIGADQVATPIETVIRPTACERSADLSYKDCLGHGIRQVEMSEIRTLSGLRSPGPGASQTNFRLANLVIHPTQLSNTEFSYFDFLVREYESRRPSQSDLGLSFQEATGDRATMQTRLPSADPTPVPMDPAACYDHGTDWEILAGETFENAWPGAWDVRRDGNVDAVWGTSLKRAARGQKSVWPAAWGSQAGGPEGLYKNGQDTWMTLGPFDLSSTSDAKFRFDRWMDTEAGDELQVGASTDGINFTTFALSGSDPQWKRDGYSMARPATQKLLGESAVWIGFRFKSNTSGRREGPYVDNICVERLSDTVALHAAPVPESPENSSTGVGLTPTLAWNYLTGALTYELQLAADQGFTNVRRSITTNGLTYGVPPGDLAKGATYWWRVRGRNNGSTGPWSTAWSFTTESDAPRVPLLSSPGVDAPSESTSLLLKWHASTNATAYDVQIAGDETFPGFYLDTSLTALEIEFVAPFVETDFFWRVRARGMGGLSDWSEVRRFTTSSSGPLVAVLRAPADDADGISEDVDLEWSNAPSAQGYRVQIADDGGFGSSGKSSAVLVDTVVADTTYGVSGLESGRVYFWRVAGIDGLGRFTWSAASRFTTLGAPGRAVTLVTPLEGSEGEPAFARFVWHALEEAHAYHIQIDADARFLMPVVDDSTLSDTMYVTQSPLAYNTRYFWRVSGRNGAGSGPWSEIRAINVAVGTAADGVTDLPTAFALYPNYPNPFNPSTTIRYDVPETSTVRLTVFDGLGRVVEVLGTWHLVPGTYSRTWEPRNVPTGVYFLRMEAGAFVASRRVLLVR